MAIFGIKCVATLVMFFLGSALCRELSSKTQVRDGFFHVEYSRCRTIVRLEDIMETCGHAINPSGLVYQPTLNRLFAVGQEYIMHLNETRTEDGEFEYKIAGCYKGSRLSLGRGDTEAAAGLDFDLPEPDREDRRWHKNWRILNNLKHHIMTVEENYEEPVVYLVDTTKLGDGPQRSDRATVAKFRIPRYPRGLEGLAFVPDLYNDIYIGTLFMGTQTKNIQACKVPLADWSQPVICNDFEAHFNVEIDMMEFDPTFKVRDGAYGALLVGSEQNNAAVYVDPYLVEQGMSNDVTLTEPFDLLTGTVDGIEMKNGIEGIQVFDNRVFFAIDRNVPRVQGVVTCYFNKPESWAKQVHGWHTYDTSQSSINYKGERAYWPRREDENGSETCKTCGSDD